ncbi:NAD(P)-dependent oxidoreductase [Caballeronia sp. LZ062]|uniref:NAD(P)-dependent oxidoreductase n=1 Tax=unclassified Caballeronia TaxID=2646786 RepID=UPI0028598EAB|nr:MULTISPECIES: NAD(P)-dependent oxidoreductase [unclassified Caballeronia]MDR5857562.1 NAD(P)-dependent oxidoreductase [Caballeronia sp. LZ050]MDR5869112.1 NAD(P)-dependent oxidoreductase [Caballeronia sp. LZ062]
MSKIAIIGATGNVGSRITHEALRRGHTVTALARDTSKLEVRDGVSARNVDALDVDALADAVAGHDAVFSATRFATVTESAIVGAVKRAGVERLLVVGGAGSLYVAPGQRVLDAPGFPDAYRAEATAGAAFLDALRRERDLNWTFVSPSAEFVSGPRTQRFRIGVDELLVDANGRSWISFDDFAIAFLDEFERGAHIKQRFTVGY